VLKATRCFKLHTAVDDNCVPLAAIITSASLNDCEAAIPLITKSNQVAVNLYDLMDAAYDHPEIKAKSISLGHIPIIDKCSHNTEQKNEKKAERGRKTILNFKTAEDKRYNERFPKERFNAQYKDYHGGRTVVFKGHSKVSCHVMFGVLVVAAAALIKLVQ
jgi:aspartate-semialdehyde dehydrogenase